MAVPNPKARSPPINVPLTQRRMSRAELSSDPLRRSKQLLAKWKRSGSDRENDYLQFGPLSFIRLPDRVFETTDQLRAAVFKTIRMRLEQQNVDTSQLNEAGISWCLPKSVKQQDTWKMLLESPLKVPADLINTLLALQPSTPDSPKPKPSDNSTKYYIRTYVIQVAHFRTILAELVDDGYGSFDQVPYWLKITDDMDIKSKITLRYCGQTKNRPWDRHVADVSSSAESSFIVRFFRLLAKTCPNVLSNTTVQTVTRVSTAFKLLAKDLDLQEQVLIALFGDGTLNIEAGGNASMNVTGDDHAAFTQLRSKNLVKLLQEGLQPCSVTLRDAVHQYASAVRKYVRANPSTTDGTRYEFTGQTENTIALQGTPSVLSGNAVMITLGSDIGELQANQASAFFEGASRASVAVSDCYNYFALWEQEDGLGQAVDNNLAKSLAHKGMLPFVNLFPWFTKNEKDYPAARKLLGQYLATVQPMVVLTFGELQTFAMTQPADSFTLKAFNNSRRGTKAVEENLGNPRLVKTDGFETIVLPCFHPGYLAHIGIMREKAQSLLLMTLAIGWLAASCAITITLDNPELSRKLICLEIVKEIKIRLQLNHPFGKLFEASKKEFLIARTAYYEGKITRSKAPGIPKPPAGLLPTITQHIRRGRVADIGMAADAGLGGFEVLVQEYRIQGPKSDNVRFSLTWVDDDGMNWVLAPILLPTEVTPTSTGDKRFIFFVPGGVDIRNSTGQSVGTRKPISSGNTKVETLPISSILLSMSEKNELSDFVTYWEEITEINLDRVWSTKGAGASASTESFLPSSFFEASHTRYALPFANKSLKKDAYDAHLSKLRKTLPANPGDMLWLIDRFLAEFLPTGGQIDLAAGSEHAESVYHAISMFCSKAKYKYHPHLRTFKALVNIVEQGAAERLIATNALVFAFEILRQPCDKKPKSLKLTLSTGEIRQSKRFVMTLGGNIPKGAICAWIEPDLESDMRLVDDVTDDDDDKVADAGGGPNAQAVSASSSSHKLNRKRGRRDDSEEGEDGADAGTAREKRSKKLARTLTVGGKGKGRA